MSITLGDNLKHNNPIFPIVDIEDVKGGTRVIATFSNTDLYNAFNDIPDKLKQNYSNLIVTRCCEKKWMLEKGSETQPSPSVGKLGWGWR